MDSLCRNSGVSIFNLGEKGQWMLCSHLHIFKITFPQDQVTLCLRKSSVTEKFWRANFLIAVLFVIAIAGNHDQINCGANICHISSRFRCFWWQGTTSQMCLGGKGTVNYIFTKYFWLINIAIYLYNYTLLNWGWSLLFQSPRMSFHESCDPGQLVWLRRDIWLI